MTAKILDGRAIAKEVQAEIQADVARFESDFSATPTLALVRAGDDPASVSYARMIDEIRAHHEEDRPEAVSKFLERFEAADVTTKGQMLSELKRKNGTELLYKGERKGLRRIHRLELVKRSLLVRIAAAWLITVPLAGILAAMFFFMIRGIMLP